MTQDAQSVTQEREDDFQGDTAHLITCIDALLDLDDAKALVPHGLGRGSHAYRLLCAARHRLASQPTSAEDAVAWQWRACEDGSARTAWYPVGYGDEKDWQALAKSNSRFAVERRALYARPTPAQTAAIGAEAMRETLESVQSQCQFTISQYERNGPSYTSQATGEEYEPASFVQAKMHELLATVERALSQPVAAPQAEKRVEDGHADTEGEAIERFAHLNCPACGGSGHVDDVTPPQPEGGTVVYDLLAALIQVRDNNRKGVKGAEARRGWVAANAAIERALQPEKTK